MRTIEIAGHAVSPLAVYGAAGAAGFLLYLHLRRPAAPAPLDISAAGVGVPGAADQIVTPEATGGGGPNPNPTPTPTPVEPAGAPPLPPWAAGIPGAHYITEFVGAWRRGGPNRVGYRLVDASGHPIGDPNAPPPHVGTGMVGPGSSLPGGGVTRLPGIDPFGIEYAVTPNGRIF